MAKLVKRSYRKRISLRPIIIDKFEAEFEAKKKAWDKEDKYTESHLFNEILHERYFQERKGESLTENDPIIKKVADVSGDCTFLRAAFDAERAMLLDLLDKADTYTQEQRDETFEKYLASRNITPPLPKKHD